MQINQKLFDKTPWFKTKYSSIILQKIKATMAVGFIRGLVTPLKKPENAEMVIQNSITTSIRGAFVTGTLSIIFAIFSRFVVQEGPWHKNISLGLTPMSLISCGTFAVAASFFIYRMWRGVDDKLNRKIEVYGWAIVALIGTLTLPTYFSSYRKQGFYVCCSLDTICLLLCYHGNQMRKVPYNEQKIT